MLIQYILSNVKRRPRILVLLDFWIIFDNSTESPSIVAYEESGKQEIVDPNLFAKLSENLVRP